MTTDKQQETDEQKEPIVDKPSQAEGDVGDSNDG